MLSYIVAKRVFNKKLNEKLAKKINASMFETKDFNFFRKNRYKNYINYYKTSDFKRYKPNLKK